jgi:hypothetical protein
MTDDPNRTCGGRKEFERNCAPYRNTGFLDHDFEMQEAPKRGFLLSQA